MTRDELIAFEREVADLFNAGKIRAPVHLDGGNEDQLIEIFRDVRPDDWVMGSWRMHYKCLLHGVPPAQLMAEIMAGRSIELCFPERRIMSSAIVGGILPIALGVARSIKAREGTERVWCFLGDMTAETGLFHECHKYADNHALPVTWVIEDNGRSVCTDTREVWGTPQLKYRVRRYCYHTPWPHAGAGQRVQF